MYGLALRLVLGADEWMMSIIHYEHLVNKFLAVDSVTNNGHAASTWPAILWVCYPHLANKDLRECLVLMVLRIVHNQRSGACMHDFAEIFSGCANLTLEMLRANFKGCAFDIAYGEDHNLLTSKGLRMVLDCLGTLKHRALLWLGTKCSSFVVLCRYQSQRYASNQWLGDETRPWVREGNALMEVSSMIYLIAYLAGLLPVLEQPQSSVMSECYTLRSVLDFTASRQYITYMGAFNGPSQKPFQLWSPWQRISLLCRRRPVDISCEDPLVRRHDGQFTGNKEQLVKSQAYTKEFGKAVMELCTAEWTDMPSN